MVHAPITAIYGALSGALLVALAIRVTNLRRSEKVGLGAGNSKVLERAIRVHGNAAEYVPTAIVLLLVVELNGGEPWMLHAFGASLFAARLFHAQGLSKSAGVSIGRFVGTAVTFAVILGLAITAAALALTAGWVEGGRIAPA